MEVLKGYMKFEGTLVPIGGVNSANSSYSKDKVDSRLNEYLLKDNDTATNLIAYGKEYIGNDTTVDLSKGLVQLLSSSNITLPSPPTEGSVKLTVICTSDSVTWNGPLVWLGGEAPSFESNVNIVNFIGIGSTWYGSYGSGVDKSANVPDYNKVTYTTPGTYSLDLPTGVTKVQLTVAGGGGAGGYGFGGKGGNGGKGGYQVVTKQVAEFTTLTITVGAGGIAPDNIAAVNGNNSVVSCGNFTVTSTGGEGGIGYAVGSSRNGANGTPVGAGGAGGIGGNNGKGTNGSNGWVYIEYGFGIE